MTKIEAVIFDWAGTTVDYGCFAPVQAFKEAFNEYGLHPTYEEIRAPMGMLKKVHIQTMLESDYLKEEFQNIYARDYNETDIDNLYAIFEKKLMLEIHNHTDVKPFIIETIDELRKRGIKIGSTTGYTDSMMVPVLKAAKIKGYSPDFWCSPESTHNLGRPYPYMIFENMKALKILSVDNVIKVGDTVADIKEGKAAGVLSIGIIEGSSLLGLREEEYLALSNIQKENMCNKVRETYRTAGADEVFLNMSELVQYIDNREKQ